eukprot:5357638-Amphidinium_carterae.1
MCCYVCMRAHARDDRSATIGGPPSEQKEPSMPPVRVVTIDLKRICHTLHLIALSRMTLVQAIACLLESLPAPWTSLSACGGHAPGSTRKTHIKRILRLLLAQGGKGTLGRALLTAFATVSKWKTGESSSQGHRSEQRRHKSPIEHAVRQPCTDAGPVLFQDVHVDRILVGWTRKGNNPAAEFEVTTIALKFESCQE